MGWLEEKGHLRMVWFSFGLKSSGFDSHLLYVKL
jgi:hypothetical protein